MGIFGLALCAYMYFTLKDLNFWSRLWPYLIESVFLGIPAILLLIRAFRRPSEIKATFRNNRGSLKSVLVNKKTLDFIVVIGGLTLSALTLEWLGFTGACMLFALIVLGYFGRRISSTIIGTVAFGAAMYLMRVACSFPLPKGILGI